MFCNIISCIIQLSSHVYEMPKETSVVNACQSVLEKAAY